MTQPLKVVFAGTPDFAARHLQALIASHHEVIAVYSQPDRPAGRGKKLQASPVKQLAIENDIDVLQPENFKSEEARQQLSAISADVMVVVAYGLILPQAVLDMPKLGCLNVHGSLLPKWRGAAPIQRSIWAGDAETGVTIMQMDKGLDTGAMLLKRALPIESDDTSASLYEKLAEIGPDALIETLDNLTNLSPEVQDSEQASYAEKLSKQEAKIDWNLSAAQLVRNVRAFNPWPVVYFEVGAGPVKVWKAEVAENTKNASPGTIIQADRNGIVVATGEDAICLHVMQLPGKKQMPVSDILNSRRDWFEVGTNLT